MNALQIFGLIVGIILLIGILSSIKTVGTGNVAVTTVFGKYHGIKRPGLNLLIPFIERIHRRISVQNRAVELQFYPIQPIQ